MNFLKKLFGVRISAPKKIFISFSSEEELLAR